MFAIEYEITKYLDPIDLSLDGTPSKAMLVMGSSDLGKASDHSLTL